MATLYYRTNSHEKPYKAETTKGIVLDLDETLVHTGEEISELRELEIMTDSKLLPLRKRIYIIDVHEAVSNKGSGEFSKMWGVTRPHLDEFLRFCFDYFAYVIIWSAGRDRYVRAVLDNIFRDLQLPHLIYTWNQLDDKEMSQKPLAKIFADPKLKGKLDLSNTLIVDDRDTAFTLANPLNGIVIPAYDPDPNLESLQKDDQCLIKLMNWFKRPEIKHSRDVRNLDKNNIFA